MPKNNSIFIKLRNTFYNIENFAEVYIPDEPDSDGDYTLVITYGDGETETLYVSEGEALALEARLENYG